ncbi:hypothetical protein EC396_11235 [Lutibacter sp. HS1-25]|uniref:hypothetical protein n=1 Tax=Lutibacter sp. HS1-25 TaxID=2485000 RepID=UPI001012F1A9|nr:hypothetical protein [Lutibacter sp. HS1-25]RXP52475.1 hypothetical protein EC396_11235 [Lutibacter sp. HS1-25]
MNKINNLIIEYYNSNDLKEKLELKKELLKMNNSRDFKTSLMAHFDTFKKLNTKCFLDAMLKFSH